MKFVDAEVYQQYQCIYLKHLNSGFCLIEQNLKETFFYIFAVNCQIEISSKCISSFKIEDESKRAGKKIDVCGIPVLKLSSYKYT